MVDADAAMKPGNGDTHATRSTQDARAGNCRRNHRSAVGPGVEAGAGAAGCRLARQRARARGFPAGGRHRPDRPPPGRQPVGQPGANHHHRQPARRRGPHRGGRRIAEPARRQQLARVPGRRADDQPAHLQEDELRPVQGLRRIEPGRGDRFRLRGGAGRACQRHQHRRIRRLGAQARPGAGDIRLTGRGRVAALHRRCAEPSLQPRHDARSLPRRRPGAERHDGGADPRRRADARRPGAERASRQAAAAGQQRTEAVALLSRGAHVRRAERSRARHARLDRRLHRRQSAARGAGANDRGRAGGGGDAGLCEGRHHIEHRTRVVDPARGRPPGAGRLQALGRDRQGIKASWPMSDGAAGGCSPGPGSAATWC